MRTRVLAAVLLVAIGLAWPARARAEAVPPLTARAAVLVEAATGTVLFEKRAYLRAFPASTTKILTALVAVRALAPEAVVAVSRRAAATPGSSARLVAGERYRFEELLKGMLLRSGNDAAVAIAEAVAGDEAAFARRMNALAQAEGAEASHFMNASGLHHPDHFTTPHDLAVLARALLAQPRLRRVVGLAETTFGPLGGPARRIRNTNGLLGVYEGTIGVKTGTTDQAGRCLVAAARRHGMVLVSVVLGSADRYGDSRGLLDYGFRRYRLAVVARRGETVRSRGRIVGRLSRDEALVLPVGSPAPVGVPVAGVRGWRLWVRVGGEPRRAVPLDAPSAGGAWGHVRRLLPILGRAGLLQS